MVDDPSEDLSHVVGDAVVLRKQTIELTGIESGRCGFAAETLTEEIRFEGGRILNNRFSQYKVPRFRDVPELDSIFLDRPDLPSVGAGETPMIAGPPAAANAVFDACGVRLRSMPLRGSEVKA